MRMKTTLTAAALIGIASGPAIAQDGARESISLSVGCRDKAEMTREICFPFTVTDLEVTLRPVSVGSAEVTDQWIDGQNGCVTVKVAAWGERRLGADSKGSFESREAKARDPLKIPQCKATYATVAIRVKY